MELLLLSVAIIGTSAGSILIGHAIVRLVHSKTIAGNNSDPTVLRLHPPDDVKSEPLSLLHCFRTAVPASCLKTGEISS